MVTLICHAYPELRVLNPATGDYAQFQGGKLEIEEDDIDYGVVMAEAASNPSIQIIVTKYTCTYCGQDFGEKKASKDDLADHIRDAHFDIWQVQQDLALNEARNIELKARAGIICDACKPSQTFPDQDAFDLHNQKVHLSAPPMDAEGNTTGGEEPAVVGTVTTTIPAAKKK